MGLVASLYSAPKTLLINYAYKQAPTPYNNDWLGTSMLAALLEKEGYHVYAASSWNDVLKLSNDDRFRRVIVVVISPDKPVSRGEAGALFNSLALRNTSILVADENTTSNELTRPYGIEVSGKIIFIVRLMGSEGNASIYVPATMRVPASSGKVEEYHLVLSIASRLKISNTQAYTSIEATSTASDGSLVGVFVKSRSIGGVVNRVAVFSDGTIFLNTALSHSTREMNYTGFALETFKALSLGSKPNETAVIFDLSHYETSMPNLDPSLGLRDNVENYLKAPLPIIIHPAMIVYLLLVLARNVEDVFYSNLSHMPLLGIPVLALASYVSYRALRGTATWDTIEDELEHTVNEVSMVSQTLLRESLISRKKISRKQAISSLHNLYELINQVLWDNMGMRLEQIASDPRELEVASRLIGVDKERLALFAGTLVRLEEKYRGERKLFPLVIRSNTLLKKMIQEAEYILENLGYTLTGEGEGVKGVEYGVRRY